MSIYTKRTAPPAFGVRFGSWQGFALRWHHAIAIQIWTMRGFQCYTWQRKKIPFSLAREKTKRAGGNPLFYFVESHYTACAEQLLMARYSKSGNEGGGVPPVLIVFSAIRRSRRIAAGLPVRKFRGRMSSDDANRCPRSGFED